MADANTRAIKQMEVSSRQFIKQGKQVESQ